MVKSRRRQKSDTDYLHWKDAHTVSQLSEAHRPEISMWSATHTLSELCTQLVASQDTLRVIFGLSDYFFEQWRFYSYHRIDGFFDE